MPARPTLLSALRCRCPRCGRGRLYRSLLGLENSCADCGLDLSACDTGDGPAVFAMFILGPVVVGMALLVEALAAPPYWVHLTVWPLLVPLGALAVLRPLKSVLVALEYRHRPDDGSFGADGLGGGQHGNGGRGGP